MQKIGKKSPVIRAINMLPSSSVLFFVIVGEGKWYSGCTE